MTTALLRSTLPIAFVLVASCSDRAGEGANDQASSIAHAGARGRPPSGVFTGTYHSCATTRRGVRCWGRPASIQGTPTGARNPAQLVAGGYHNCSLDEGTVKCWGENSYGQVTVPTTLVRPRQIAAGYWHTCAVDEQGVKCWGNNSYRQVTVPTTLKRPRQVAAGWIHTCALDDDGVKCWGSTNYQATTVPPLKNPREVLAGGYHTCAVDDDGLKCWGSKQEKELPLPETVRRPTQIALGYMHLCAIENGLSCWGYDSVGQSTVPPRLENVTYVSANYQHTCAVADNAVRCWGSDSNGQVRVPADVELVGRHACFETGAGVRCIGDNESGQLGVGSDQDRAVAIASATPTDLGAAFGAPTEVTTGRAFGCALGKSGAVKCWGTNDRGQLGLGDARDRGALATDMGDALPTLRFGSDPIAAVRAGENHACALSRRGEIFCWGRGDSGQLGTESTSDVGTDSGPVRPRLPSGIAEAREIAIGRAHTCFATYGRVYCFGANDRGQLGLGRSGAVGDRPDSMAALAPVDLGPDFSVKQIASGDTHVCALSTSGQVKCWGANGNGELGAGDTKDRGLEPAELGAGLAPVDLGTGQVVTEIACGARHCCAKTVQGTMKCWGDNNEGQLGTGDLVPRGDSRDSIGGNLPFVSLPRETIRAFELTSDRTCARTESGLRCWGRNRSGELGYGDREPRGGTVNTVPRLLLPLGI